MNISKAYIVWPKQPAQPLNLWQQLGDLGGHPSSLAGRTGT